MTGSIRVLVIDDEAAIRRLLRVCLESPDYIIREAASAAEGIREAAQWQPELIILDLGLPDGDGLEVIRRIREWSSTPIIVLTVRESDPDKVNALDAGADDYVTKPFSSAELLARIRVALRHVHPTDENAIVHTGPLEIDLSQRVVRLRGREIHLTATEYSLIRLLAHHIGRVVTHSQILREVWGPNAAEQRQYLRVYFGQLRRKLKASANDPPLIQTEPGIGYRLRLIE
jgi:two-component system KDP operon response regulator KdpE